MFEVNISVLIWHRMAVCVIDGLKLHSSEKCIILRLNMVNFSVYSSTNKCVLLHMTYCYIWLSHPQFWLWKCCVLCIMKYNKKLGHRRGSAWCGWNGHSRSLKVIRCCANRRGLCDFLLALNSNLTSIFNRSWDITPSLHIHTHLSSRWNWKKTAGIRWICFGVRVPRTLDYPTVKWNPR